MLLLAVTLNAPNLMAQWQAGRRREDGNPCAAYVGWLIWKGGSVEEKKKNETKLVSTFLRSFKSLIAGTCTTYIQTTQPISFIIIIVIITLPLGTD